MTNSKNKALPAGTVLRGAAYTYTIEKVLGQGAFGITYLASTLIKGPLGDLSMSVAVKEFFAKDLDSRTEDGSVTARTDDGVAFRYAKAFQRESQNLSKMKHPGIVKVLEAFPANGTYYYSMEYLSGGSLDDKVKGEGIPEEEALPMIAKIGDALSYMHEHKMMHLDLKPKNIMLKADGTPVIIDFGLSKQYDDNGEPESSTTIGLGTPGYAPIEQATQTTVGEFQPTLDIYALGATLYKMLTGKTPPAATLVLNKKASLAPDLQAKNVSPGTVDTILKAMAPLMDDRPQSVKDFLSMLEGKSVEPVDEAEDETEPKPAPKPVPTPCPAPAGGNSKIWLWALFGELAALAVAAVFMFGEEDRNQGKEGNSGVDTLVVAPTDSVTETPVASPVVESIPGSIKITSEPVGAAIWLDGKKTKEKTPSVLKDIAPGKHSIRLVLDGYKEYKCNVTVPSGGRADLARALDPVPAKSDSVGDTEEDITYGTIKAAYLSGCSAGGSFPTPSYRARIEGTVVVQVKVDQCGNVTEAVPGVEGTTVVDKGLWDATRNTAMKTKFSVEDDAPVVQMGTITYVFKLPTRTRGWAL